MTETTMVVTLSLPPELCEHLDEICRRDGWSTGEFVQEAVERRLRDCAWEELFRYGQERAQASGIRPEDVETLIEEYRREVGPSRE